MPIITLRLSDAELETVDQNAERADMNRSEYLRHVGASLHGGSIARMRRALTTTEGKLVDLLERIQKVTE